MDTNGLFDGIMRESINVGLFFDCITVNLGKFLSIMSQVLDWISLRLILT